MKAILIFILSCFVTLITAQTRIHELPAKTNADSTWLILTGNPSSGKLYKMSFDHLKDSIIGEVGTTIDTTSLSNRIDNKLNATDTASLSDRIDGKQAELVSGTNIKTINSESILGSGDIEIIGVGGGGETLDSTLSLGNQTDETIIFTGPTSSYNFIEVNPIENHADQLVLNFTRWSSAQAGHINNEGLLFGFNINAGGGQIESGLPGIAESWETGYYPAGDRYVEKHEIYMPPGGTSIRLSSYTINTATGSIELYHTANPFILKDNNSDVYFSASPSQVKQIGDDPTIWLDDPDYGMDLLLQLTALGASMEEGGLRIKSHYDPSSSATNLYLDPDPTNLYSSIIFAGRSGGGNTRMYQYGSVGDAAYDNRFMMYNSTESRYYFVEDSGRVLLGYAAQEASSHTVQMYGTINIATSAGASVMTVDGSGITQFTGGVGIGTTAANGDLEVNNNIIANDRNANKVTIGSVSPTYQEYPGIWFGSATPTITNYAFLADVTNSFTILNAPNGGTIALRINNTTTMNISSVVNLASSARQVFADDAAAGAGGLVTGDIYQTSAGVLMIKQ